MESRRVRRRLESPSRDDSVNAVADFNLFLATAALLMTLNEKSWFQRLGPILRLTHPDLRDAVNQFITSLRFDTGDVLNGEPRCATLQKFRNVKSVVFEKSEDCPIRADLRDLSQLTQLTALGFSGVSKSDLHSVAALWELPCLKELRIDGSTALLDAQVDLIPCRHHLRSLAIHTVSYEAVEISARIWGRFPSLESLSVELEAPSAAVGLDGIRQLAYLRVLRVSLPLDASDLTRLASMHQLQSLFLTGRAQKGSSLSCLSALTQLTRLEFATALLQLPLWLEHLTKLRCLNLHWEYSYSTGMLFPGILSPTLTCLTLHNFRGPLRREIFRPLTSLQKLSLRYNNTHRVVDHPDALQDLMHVSELFLCITSDAWHLTAPSLGCVTGLKELFLETTNGVNPVQIQHLATTLTQLRHLTIGSDLSDAELMYLSCMPSLESLTLFHCAHWTWFGFFSLTKLEKLSDIGLYHCPSFPITQATLTELLTRFTALEHLGMFPLDQFQSHLIPYLYENGNRSLMIDDKCKVNAYFDGNDESSTHP